MIVLAFGDLAHCPGFSLGHFAFELVEDFFDVPAKLVDERELVGGDGDLLITSTGLASLQDTRCRGLFSGGIARWARPPATRCHPSGMKEFCVGVFSVNRCKAGPRHSIILF